MSLPQVVPPAEWQIARDTLLAKEKEATRARDALAAERRRLPMVRIDKDYRFEGPEARRPWSTCSTNAASGSSTTSCSSPARPSPAGVARCSRTTSATWPTARPRHVTGPGVPGAAGGDRAVQGAHGLDGAVVLRSR